jgi:hypothetical protein
MAHWGDRLSRCDGHWVNNSIRLNREQCRIDYYLWTILAITIDLSREAQLFVGWVSGIVVQGLSFLRFGLMAGVTGVFYRLGR